VKFLLDTNIISELRKRDRVHPNVARWVNTTPVEEIGTSVIVLAEIRHGIERDVFVTRASRILPRSATG
jgi:predicted nucleic acid-binding protein